MTGLAPQRVDHAGLDRVIGVPHDVAEATVIGVDAQGHGRGQSLVSPRAKMLAT